MDLFQDIKDPESWGSQDLDNIDGPHNPVRRPFCNTYKLQLTKYQLTKYLKVVESVGLDQLGFHMYLLMYLLPLSS